MTMKQSSLLQTKHTHTHTRIHTNKPLLINVVLELELLLALLPLHLLAHPSPLPLILSLHRCARARDTTQPPLENIKAVSRGHVRGAELQHKSHALLLQAVHNKLLVAKALLAAVTVAAAAVC